jgi:hypothetical protein
MLGDESGTLRTRLLPSLVSVGILSLVEALGHVWFGREGSPMRPPSQDRLDVFTACRSATTVGWVR